MNGKQKIAVIVFSVTLAVIAATTVKASSSISNTPLYTVRMEQASSGMNFLPTQVNEFTYITEKGYSVNYATLGYCGVSPFSTGDTCEPDTCELETCEDPTCPWTCWQTCSYTCNPTCNSSTCLNTCPSTCRTCPPTCPLTCEPTCREFTCVKTCAPTCPDTCWYTCESTC